MQSNQSNPSSPLSLNPANLNPSPKQLSRSPLSSTASKIGMIDKNFQNSPPASSSKSSNRYCWKCFSAPFVAIWNCFCRCFRYKSKGPYSPLISEQLARPQFARPQLSDLPLRQPTPQNSPHQAPQLSPQPSSQPQLLQQSLQPLPQEPSQKQPSKQQPEQKPLQQLPQQSSQVQQLEPLDIERSALCVKFSSLAPPPLPLTSIAIPRTKNPIAQCQEEYAKINELLKGLQSQSERHTASFQQLKLIENVTIDATIDQFAILLDLMQLSKKIEELKKQAECLSTNNQNKIDLICKQKEQSSEELQEILSALTNKELETVKDAKGEDQGLESTQENDEWPLPDAEESNFEARIESLERNIRVFEEVITAYNACKVQGETDLQSINSLSEQMQEKQKAIDVELTKAILRDVGKAILEESDLPTKLHFCTQYLELQINLTGQNILPLEEVPMIADMKMAFEELRLKKLLSNLEELDKEIHAENHPRTITDLDRLRKYEKDLEQFSNDVDLPDVEKVQETIEKIRSSLVDLQGLVNMNKVSKSKSGHTCWLNAALQALRLNPVIFKAMNTNIKTTIIQQLKNNNPDFATIYEKNKKIMSSLEGEELKAFKQKANKEANKFLPEPAELKKREFLRKMILGVWEAMRKGTKETETALIALDDLLHPKKGDYFFDWVNDDIVNDRTKNKDPMTFIHLVIEKLGLLDQCEMWARKIGSTDDYSRRRADPFSSLAIAISQEDLKKGKVFTELLNQSAYDTVEYNISGNGNEPCERVMRISNPPQLLVTQLKRFAFTAVGGVSSQVVTKVTDDVLKYLSERKAFEKNFSEKDLQSKVKKFISEVFPEITNTSTFDEESEALEKFIRKKTTEKVKGVMGEAVRNCLGKPAEPVAIKIQDPILFPADGVINLTDSPYFEKTDSNQKPIKYRLTAVCVHQGKNISDGHYVTYAKGADGYWRLYDDSRVELLTQEVPLEIQRGYVLFWEKLSPEEASAHEEAPIQEIAASQKPKVTSSSLVGLSSHSLGLLGLLRRRQRVGSASFNDDDNDDGEKPS